MPSLLHLPLDPFSRKIRIVLGEKKITASLAVEPIWERRHEFLSINPAGTVPVFIEDDGTTISTSQAIAEYLEETSKEPALIFGNENNPIYLINGVDYNGSSGTHWQTAWTLIQPILP